MKYASKSMVHRTTRCFEETGSVKNQNRETSNNNKSQEIIECFV